MSITERNKKIYQRVAGLSSRVVTRNYSTSFSLSIYLLDKSIRDAVYAIYGFVRLADEIVDTFTDHDREQLLANFKTETYRALDAGISMNPILHNFQHTANRYAIDRELIEAFFKSMETDLYRQKHHRRSFDKYIFGSAEVVGLMCLKVFCEGDSSLYRKLKPCAGSLGAAFQKVNFLRDISQDVKSWTGTIFHKWKTGNSTLPSKG